MEVASVSLARSIWLFDTDELNPQGVNLYPEIFGGLVGRYQFRTSPTIDDLIGYKNRRFSEGKFVRDELSVEVALEMWRDGLVGETRHSTEVTDAFLADLVQWMGSELRVCYPNNLVKKRAYRSELVVYAGRGLAGVCDKLDSFAAEVASVVSDAAELSAIVFGSESKHASFTFDRRIRAPHAENKFFSTALMDSDSHLALLQKLDGVLAS